MLIHHALQPTPVNYGELHSKPLPYLAAEVKKPILDGSMKRLESRTLQEVEVREHNEVWPIHST